jgi:hypothetical protein
MTPRTRPGEEPEKQVNKNDPTFGGRVIFSKKENVKIVFPSEKNKVEGRILPAFDHTLPLTDEAFQTSYLPYRDAEAISSSGHPHFNWWYYAEFEVYRFWGPENRSFFSPRTKRALGIAETRADSFDPLDRMNYMVRNDEKWKHLSYHTVFNSSEKRLLTMPQKIGLCNFFGTYTVKDDEEQVAQNFLLGLSQGGFSLIQDALNKGPRGNPAYHDANWPDYLLGDVTDPKTGLNAWSTQKAVGAAKGAGKPANTMIFSTQEDFLKGHEAIAVPPEALVNRTRFLDFENTMYIPSAHEIVTYLIEETDLPVELIKEACGDYVQVPERTAQYKDTTKRQPPVQEASEARRPPTQFKSSAPVDDDDDIPMSHATDKGPKETATKVAATISGLTDEEEATFAELQDAFDNGRISDLGAQAMVQYFTLAKKKKEAAVE